MGEDDVVKRVCARIHSKVGEGICEGVAKRVYEDIDAKECSPSEVEQANPIWDKVKEFLCQELEKGGEEDDVVNRVCSRIHNPFGKDACVFAVKKMYEGLDKKECSPSEVIV